MGNDELTAPQKRDIFFELHMRLWIATCIFCIFVWMLTKPWTKPWFAFVFSGAGLLMTIHYSASYIDWKRQWLFPQLQLYLNTSYTCYIANTFFGGRFTGAWWLWPTCVWGILILIQFPIFIMITKRRIRLGEIDTEAQGLTKRKRTGLRRVPSEVPLLVDFSRDMDAPSPISPKHALNLPNDVHRGRQAPSPQIIGRDLGQPPNIRPRQLPPRAADQGVPLLWTPPQELRPESVESDDAALLVECVSTPPARLSAKLKPSPHVTRPISMRVVHHDEHTAEVVDDSYTGSEGVYIDVVHVPSHGATGFG